MKAGIEYWSRPYAVRWVSSYFQGEFRFDTIDEAFDYIQQQWLRIKDTVRRERHVASNLRQSKLITPDGEVSLRYVLLADDVSSY
jgi:hypothetical protein